MKKQQHLTSFSFPVASSQINFRKSRADERDVFAPHRTVFIYVDYVVITAIIATITLDPRFLALARLPFLCRRRAVLAKLFHDRPKLYGTGFRSYLLVTQRNCAIFTHSRDCERNILKSQQTK